MKLHLTNYKSFFSGSFGCMVSFQKGDVVNHVRYTLKVDFFKGQKDVSFYRIDRVSEVYINDMLPNSFIDQLANEASKVIYPIELVVRNGKIIDIINFDQIKERWKVEESRIKEYYIGELAENYLRANKNTINNKELFLYRISKDWFFYTYFNLKNNDEFEDYLKFPTAGKSAPVRYKVSYSKEHREIGSIFVTAKGEIDDERCAEDFEQQMDSPYFREENPEAKALKGTCKIVYFINSENRMIEGINAKFVTEFSETKTISVKMFLLQEDKEKKIASNYNIL